MRAKQILTQVFRNLRLLFSALLLFVSGCCLCRACIVPTNPTIQWQSSDQPPRSWQSWYLSSLPFLPFTPEKGGHERLSGCRMMDTRRRRLVS